MQLYIFPPSPNSLRCQAVANQVGIDLELVTLDLMSGAHMSPDFIALNPNHKIPTLVDGDYVLWESGAIMLYLARTGAANDLVPEDVPTRARMMQWLFWNECHFAPTCGIFTFENLVKQLMQMGAADPARLEHGAQEFARFGTVLNDHLKGRSALVGDSVTLADHAVASWLVPHAQAAGIPVGDYAEIMRWSGDVLSSTAWQNALATIPH